MSNIRALEELLRKHRKKSRAKVAKDIGVNIATIEKWENLEISRVLPTEEKLPLISKVYEIPFEELKLAWLESMDARMIETNVRKSLKSKCTKLLEKRFADKFPGSVSNQSDVARLNSQLERFPRWKK